jgi:hypothetical protein
MGIISHILGAVKIFYAGDLGRQRIFLQDTKKIKKTETFFEKPLAFFEEVWYNIPRCTGV